MSMLDIAKKLKAIHNRPELTESKADTQNLVDFAGKDLAARFLAIKNKLKAPESDLYYWIKKNSVAELEKAIIAAEKSKSKSQISRDTSDEGAKLVCDSEHWKVYHITTYAASRKYGRDTKWCITGINNEGDTYWNEYTGKGMTFYFLIAKHGFSSRGTDGKYALAVYPGAKVCEVFNQQDEAVALEDVPHIDEVTIPGLDLESLKTHYCSVCGQELYHDEYYTDDDGNIFCNDCRRDVNYAQYLTNGTQFTAEFLAFTTPDYDEYEGEGSFGDGSATIHGTLHQLIKKLNAIATNHSFSFVYIYPSSNHNVTFLVCKEDNSNPGRYILKRHPSISRDEPFIKNVLQLADEVKEILPENLTRENVKKLAESIISNRSFAEEFKLYENLWN